MGERERSGERRERRLGMDGIERERGRERSREAALEGRVRGGGGGRGVRERCAPTSWPSD